MAKLLVLTILVWVYCCGMVAGYWFASHTHPACVMEIDQ